MQRGIKEQTTSMDLGWREVVTWETPPVSKIICNVLTCDVKAPVTVHTVSPRVTSQHHTRLFFLLLAYVGVTSVLWLSCSRHWLSLFVTRSWQSFGSFTLLVHIACNFSFFFVKLSCPPCHSLPPLHFSLFFGCPRGNHTNCYPLIVETSKVRVVQQCPGHKWRLPLATGRSKGDGHRCRDGGWRVPLSSFILPSPQIRSPSISSSLVKELMDDRLNVDRRRITPENSSIPP